MYLLQRLDVCLRIVKGVIVHFCSYQNTMLIRLTVSLLIHEVHIVRVKQV